MRIINLNTPEIPSPGNFNFTAQKFLKGFEYNGFEVLEINSLNNIDIYNDESNYFFLSNHFSGINKNIVYEIGKKLEKCTFICFHFNFEKDLRDNMPFSKYIITGEHYQNVPLSSEQHLDAYNFSLNCKEWLPMTFFSSIDPKLVGNIKRIDKYKSMFIGAPYKTNWIHKLSNCFSHIGQSNFLTEEERINVFLSSRVCLGFHSDANILNGCVTERVFEGLSYGCVVLTDNISAEKMTNGLVKYVSSFDELELNINKFNTDDNLFFETQNRGYEFSKKNGLYFHLANKFIKKIKELYG